MKKILSFTGLALILALIMIPCFSIGEAEVAEVAAEIIASEIPVEPVSWDQLATVGGTALITMLIVQYTKMPLDKIWKIPTRIIVFLISFITMLLATYFTKGLDLNNALLTIFNALIAALAAMGGYEMTFAKVEKKNS